MRSLRVPTQSSRVSTLTHDLRRSRWVNHRLRSPQTASNVLSPTRPLPFVLPCPRPLVVVVVALCCSYFFFNLEVALLFLTHLRNSTCSISLFSRRQVPFSARLLFIHIYSCVASISTGRAQKANWTTTRFFLNEHVLCFDPQTPTKKPLLTIVELYWVRFQEAYNSCVCTRRGPFASMRSTIKKRQDIWGCHPQQRHCTQWCPSVSACVSCNKVQCGPCEPICTASVHSKQF